ncbi:kelch-like protein 2 isoform X3 [Panthera pardus]|uniref:BTB domain-containing protein n=3 Tax=Felidae TaxID=9681 RepID=A0ABI7X4T8_FELCA|nr:kelch-like protein 2 isoform X3 [Acinonyx jubatus]XP_030168652.1 kelch-like protein 2 isoform X3 [Lynx canadensis]XP_044911641.1 kelch-like protein 2 isoform X3 [Felis catus]XP_046946354.1 kelch-like protein 2 isoform X3 [Lynx rufus]XP_047711386.1 kelch-like protein 2 isoform X3 [Prionailurus viverrinus]XP_049487245.1 kelch-like protein 2 isoform X2 [Panthera uncia]XP_053757125.1 kelch-like protein 2 isoform X3 [Panthera pardus]XP_058576940.1 kelch-like protein 2 isoform X3 [Neofelis nebu
METPPLPPACTKQGHQKPLDSKDDNTEKHCPVTVNPWHMKKAFKVMNELRSQNLLCDVTIVAEDMEISAHRVVLAACSPYFHAMFTGEMSESRAKRVRIKEVDGWTLRMLIDYVYTAEIQVTEENVQVLLPAAGLLQLQDVKKTCCEFLESQLHPVNCLGIRAFADMHACTDLLNKANTYAEQHFADVVLSEEFLNLGIEQVCSLISSDKLTISSEEKRVEEEALVKNSSACKDYLIEAMKYHLLPTEQRILMKSVRTRLRTPMNLPKLMVVVGGQAPKAIRSVECYDFKEERWHQVAELPSRRCRAGMVYMAGLVFAVGGFNGSLRVRTVDSYDPVKDQWTSVANMRDRRSTLGAAVLNGLLYAVGGFDGSTGLSSVEAYNIKSNEWFHVAPMNTRRSSVGVGVVGGLLYAVGGYDGASRQCLSTVECYNATTNEWTYIAEMSTRRSGAGVGVLNNLLYAVGGHDGPLVRKSVEVYDPTTNTWRQVADMNMCRRNAGVCAVNGLLYVVGGDDGSCNLASVEYYNPTTDKWTVVSSCMSTGRSYAGVTVIDKPL